MEDPIGALKWKNLAYKWRNWENRNSPRGARSVRISYGPLTDLRFRRTGFSFGRTCWFYRFSTVSICGPAGLIFLPIFAHMPDLPFYQFYHFVALFDLPFLPRVNFSSFRLWHLYPHPTGFAVFQFTILAELADAPFYNSHFFRRWRFECFPPSVFTILPFV